MKKIEARLARLERHRRFQIVISTGALVSALAALLWPEKAHASVIAGLVTNLIWIWE